MKDKLMTFTFLLVLFAFMAWHLISPDLAFSYSERRKLQVLPDLTVDSLMDGSFFEDFRDYAVDHFPWRDGFRGIKHQFALDIFGQEDLNGIYYGQGHIFKKTELSPKDYEHFTAYIKGIQDLYFKENDLYLAMIPDKSYYYDHPTFKPDYDLLVEWLQEDLENISYISLLDSLQLEDYYETDPHWKQDGLQGVMDTIGREMGFDLYETLKQEQLNDFRGAYLGQGPMYQGQEDLIYLLHEDFKEISIINYQEGKEGQLYVPSAIEGIDPYDVFLGGASPLIEIINPNASSDEEIIIFRDSYGSNISPLFLKHYSKVTLVDTRYMPAASLADYMEIANQDVLFLYSALLMNNSFGLK